MNEGVKVLIERMKTNPEDFQLVQDKKSKYDLKEGKFYWVKQAVESYLTGEQTSLHLMLLKQQDLDALVDAYRDMHQQQFTNKVMNHLFKEEEVAPEVAGGWLPQGARTLQNTNWTDPRIAYLSQQQQAQNALSGLTSVSTGAGIVSISNGGTGAPTGWFSKIIRGQI
jgi:hypothetical protein